MVTFTHDRELPWLLPGVAPDRAAGGGAGDLGRVRAAPLPGGPHHHADRGHRTLWDQVGLLTQLRLAA